MNPTQHVSEMTALAAELSVWAADTSTSGMGMASDEVVLSALQQVEHVSRLLAAVQVHLAAVVEQRTDVGGLSDGLAFQYGYTRAAPFIEHITQVSNSEARRRIRVGKNVRSRTTLTGELMPPVFEHIGRALATGEMSVAVADRVMSGLEQARSHHIVGENEQPGEFEENLHAAEESLVEQAATEPADNMVVQINAWRDALDPDGAPLRDEDIRARRGLRKGPERNGVTRFIWDTTGPTTAFLLAILAAGKAARTPRFIPTDASDPSHLLDPNGVVLATPEETAALLFDDTLDGTNPDHVTNPDPSNVNPTTRTAGAGAAGECEEMAAVVDLSDTRTPAQRDSDLLEGYLRAGLRASENELGSTRSVIGVTAVATLADLEAGRGVGYIDGLDTPISINQIKELACGTGYRLIIQGNNGEVLWLGPKPRKFTDAQKHAVIIRDGGTCVIDGCHKPARQCDVHHVHFHGQGGPTDIDNAVILCSEHHHMIHSSPFRIEMHHGKPFLLAPRWLNPNQSWTPLSHPKYRSRPRTHHRDDWETTLNTAPD